MKRVIFILLFALLGVLSAHAYDFKVDGIYYAYAYRVVDWDDETQTNVWERIDGEVEVVYKEAGNITSYSGVVVIPATVMYNGTSYRVTQIGDSAFYGCSGLTSVTIPESITYIGDAVFSGCSGLKVEWNASHCSTQRGYNSIHYPIYIEPFKNAQLTSITFGSEVKSIPAYLCYGCSGLSSVTIPEGVTGIGREAFYCSSLTSVEWNAVTSRDFYNDNYVGEYAYSAFYNCKNITSITFGSRVEHIPAWLCYGLSGLTKVTIPESVTYIGAGAFYGCSGLTSVTIPESVDTIGSSGFWTSSAFTGCTSIRSPLYNSKIFAYMPKDYSGEYVIPSGIQSIVPYAFVDCQGPISVTIPNSVTSIGSYAFADCSGLTSVTIPESVDTIGYRAFSDCENLLSVTSLSRTPPYCESSAFSVYGTLYVPYGCKMAYQTAQEWYKFIRIEELPSAGMATVTVNVNDASMGTVVGGGKYELGEQAILAAIPNKDCYFDHWNDGNTSNPRILTVTGDTTLTAVFAKYGSEPTANENADTDNLRVYVQNRTIYLSEDRGTVQVYNAAGQCIYNGHATTIPVQQGGVYIVRVGVRSYKIMVR